MTETKIPLRQDVPEQQRWDHASVFASVADWERAGDQVAERAVAIRQLQGTLAQGGASLLTALRARDDLLQLVEHVYVYAGLLHLPDTANEEASSMFGRAQTLHAGALAACAWIEPESLALGEERLEALLAAEPGLATYRHYLDDLLRRVQHVRSQEVEELLGLLVEPFSGVGATMTRLTSADFKFEPAVNSQGAQHELVQGTLDRYQTSPDRALRASAWHNYHRLYHQHKHGLTNNLLTSVQQNVFMMRARRHDSTLEAALFQDNIPVEVFHRLLKVAENRAPIWHRYFELRRRRLGLEQLEPHDIWAPLGNEPVRLSYEQAVDHIVAGLAPLGDDYVAVLRQGALEDRWVDIYPNQGKRSGAFSFGSFGTHPFIMMSFNGSLLSLSTLAHELGHSLHSYYSWQNQPFVYSDYSLFAAEVASNFHQAMVRSHLLSTQNEPAFRLGVIEEAMSNFHRYFLVMPTLARLELEVHQRVESGEGLNAQYMIDRSLDLFQQVYGPAMKLTEENAGMYWSTFGHLYRDYYVFQYATGIAAAHALAGRIQSGEHGAVEAYRGFLACGGSVYAIDGLRQAGVDMTDSRPVQAAFDSLELIVDALEALV